MKFSYFLGCITPNRYPEIELSTIKTLNAFDIDVIILEGTSCCPAPGVFGSFDLSTWLTLAARNLCVAEGKGLDVITSCNGCYGSLQEANSILKMRHDVREQVNEILSEVGMEFKGTITVKHVIEILYDNVGVKRIRENVKNPLDNLKIAVHYGCHFLKPSETRGHGSAEKPTMLDELVEATGAKSIFYKDKNMCCGAGGGLRSRDLKVSLLYTREKLINMSEAGVNCVVTPCAFCHLQFNRGQIEIGKVFGDQFKLPVLYYTQLLQRALDIT